MDYRKIFSDNWGIKLISLLLSLTLWLYVTSKGKTEMSLSVPLELRNIPQRTAVVGEVVKNLDVRVQGQERALRDVTIGKKVYGILDLSLAGIGENILRMSPDDIRRPSGISVTHISPYDVKIRLEPLISKTLKLQPVIIGPPAAGYSMTSASVSPAKITIEGPAGVMKTLTALRTMPIDIQNAKENITVEPRIDYQGKPVNILEKNISIRIVIKKEKKQNK